jgi:hypothetical protein
MTVTARTFTTRTAAALAALALASCERPALAQAAPAPSQAIPAAPQAPALDGLLAGEPAPFELELEPPLSARAGQAATARVIVRARGGFHVNRDYPMAFRPDPASLAAFGAERVALEAAERTPCAEEPAEACRISAPLRFTVREPGEARLSGTVAFSVCTRELCRIEKVPAALAVTVAR